MSNTPSRTQQLAHIASIAAKSKTEDSDVLFFKGGVYKGEWNPNATPNTFPNNTQAHDIFLVSHNGSYYGRVLAVGELVRFVSQHDPILVYSKYLPIPFFLSMLESEPPINSGGGFAYGGELNAIPQQVVQVAEFTDLDSCTVANGLFTPTGVGVAMARNIAQADLNDANIRFTWPDTTGSFFMVGFGTPTDASMQDLGNATIPTSFVAIGSGDNAGMDVTKFGQNSQNMQENTGAVVGDSILLNFDYATNEVRAYNETQAQPMMSVDVSAYSEFSNPLVLFIYATRSVNFDIADTDSPAKQVFQEVAIPESADGKTYLVTAATENSVVGGKVLKANDFVTFFSVGDVTNCVVNRLMSDADIQTIVTAMLNEPNISPLELVNPVADGVTTVMLENANEINIVVNGEYDPPPQFNFNLDDTCFTQGRLVRIRLNAAIAIPTFNIAYFNYYGESVALADIAAETSWVFVFEKRGAYAELIAKYQV